VSFEMIDVQRKKSAPDHVGMVGCAAGGGTETA
jgi:hypothetical protein